MNRLSPFDAKEREDYIVELIKESGKNGVPLDTIRDDCALKGRYANVVMSRVKDKHPEIKRKEGVKECIYIWVDPFKDGISIPQIKKETPRSPFLRSREEKAMKNSEGYMDTTAEKAIESAIEPKRGDIWLTMESSGEVGHFLVLSVSEDAVQGFKLYPLPLEFNSDDVFTLSYNRLSGNYSRITFKLKKYLTRKVSGTASDNIHEIAFKNAERFAPVGQLNPIEIVKEVEKPVEKIVEKVVTIDQYKLDDLQHQLDIWKSVAEKLLERRD